jgi:hypothetical protein
MQKENKFSKSKGLIIAEMIFYAVVLVLFLKAFIPLGLK